MKYMKPRVVRSLPIVDKNTLTRDEISWLMCWHGGFAVKSDTPITVIGVDNAIS